MDWNLFLSLVGVWITIAVLQFLLDPDVRRVFRSINALLYFIPLGLTLLLAYATNFAWDPVAYFVFNGVLSALMPQIIFRAMG